MMPDCKLDVTGAPVIASSALFGLFTPVAPGKMVCASLALWNPAWIVKHSPEVVAQCRRPGKNL